MELPMNKNSPTYLGAVLGGIVALAALGFVVTGGELGGKKTVNSDDDLPPVVSSPPLPR
jgi:hypothetical protein